MIVPIPKAPAAYSPRTLANRWGCSPRHVYKLIEAGALHSFRLGKLIRVAAGEVARIEGCGSSSTGAGIMLSGEKRAKPSGFRFEPTIGPLPNGD